MFSNVKNKKASKVGKRVEERLLDASSSGSLKKVRLLLGQGLSPNFIDESTGNNLVRAASQHGHLATVRLLLDAGADPNTPGTWKSEPPNTTPLEMACQNGHLDVAQLLIERGADVNKKGYFSPLKAAASYGQPKIIELLLKRGAKIESGTLHLAVRAGKEKGVAYLVKAGADVNYQNRDGETPLHWATWKDSQKIVEILIFAGAKIDVPTRHTRETPLHKAAQRGKIKVVKALVKAGASVTLKGWKGKNAEQWARAFKHKEVADFLRHIVGQRGV